MSEYEPTQETLPSRRLNRLLGRATKERIVRNADGSVTVGNLTFDALTAERMTPDGMRLQAAFYEREPTTISSSEN